MAILLLAEQPLRFGVHHPLRPRVYLLPNPILARTIKLVKGVVQLLLGREKHTQPLMPHNLVKHRILNVRHIRMIRQHYHNLPGLGIIEPLGTTLPARRKLRRLLPSLN